MCSDSNSYYSCKKLASLGHHEEYDEGYHEKLNYLIESVEKLQTE